MMQLRFKTEIAKNEIKNAKFLKLCQWHSFFAIWPRKVASDRLETRYVFFERIERRINGGEKLHHYNRSSADKWEFRSPKDVLVDKLANMKGHSHAGVVAQEITSSPFSSSCSL
jgi:hypothetical protein